MAEFQPWQLDLARTIEKQRKEGWGWRWDGLESWSNDAIFAQLRELGIDSGVEQFPQQAAAAGNIAVLRQDWDRQMPEDKQTAFWPDFPMLAVPLLWERLAPHVMCPDLVERRLYRVVHAEDEGTPLPDVDGLPADVAEALKLARYISSLAKPQWSAKFEEIDSEGGSYDYTSWLMDLVMNRGEGYPDAITEIADVISECTEAARFQSYLAEALVAAGRCDEAIARSRANVERFPQDVWVKILAGDVCRDTGDHAEAQRLWLEALTMAEERYDWEGAEQRLRKAFEREGRHQELEDILRKYPIHSEVAPAPSPRAEVRPSAAELLRAISNPRSDERPAQQKKIGRNDPCSCGSGKKYKKCCGK